VHYPVPIHLQGAFAHLGHRQGAFPATEAAAREILSLPLYPEITADQQEQVVDRLRGALP
jgi:dTDP-4-amino-4,6-dideoxygalactose transaminase